MNIGKRSNCAGNSKALKMKIFCCVLLLGLWSMALAQTCPQPYPRYTKSHTYCLPANRTCDLKDYTVTSNQAKEIVTKHNQLRSKVANGQESIGNLPPAKNMMEMLWDEELAEIAKRHAVQCRFEHDCNDCRRARNFGAGQNLFMSWTSASDAQPDWNAAIQAWYDEVKDFNSSMVPKFGTPQAKGVIGHLTQVIWANSWRVGCGYSKYRDGGKTYQLYTCNYGPAGNFGGRPVYEAGKTCSACPANTCCNGSCKNGRPNAVGLCQVVGNSIPVFDVKNPDEYLYFCNFTENGKNCNIGQPLGQKQWNYTNTLSGSYIGVVLQKGESSRFDIGKEFGSDKGLCITIFYRKGPNVAGEASGNEFQVYVKQGSSTAFTIQPSWDSTDFTSYKMSAGFTDKYKMSVEFKATTGTQYLEISELSVKAGGC